MATQMKLPDGRVVTTNQAKDIRNMAEQGGRIIGGEFPEEFNSIATPEALQANNYAREKGLGGWNQAGNIAYYDPSGVARDNNGQPVQEPLVSLLQGDATNPTLGSNLTAKAGPALLPGVEQKLNNINVNKEGINALRAYGTAAPGTSAWEQMMLGRQGIEESIARDKAMKTARQGAANAFSDLATRGGAGSGARERLARGVGEQTALARQNVIRQGALDRFGIGSQAEDKRLDVLKGLPAAEVQAVQPDLEKTRLWGLAAEGDRRNTVDTQKFNIENILRQKTLEEAAKNKRFADVAGMYGADKTASAQEQTGGSCWLISGLSEGHYLPSDEPELLTRFKQYMLCRNPKAASFYIRDCGELITKMNEAGFSWKSLVGWNNALVNLLRSDMLAAAYVVFRDQLVDLIGKYWEDCDYQAYDLMKEEIKQDRNAVREAFNVPEKYQDLNFPCLTNLDKERFLEF